MNSRQIRGSEWWVRGVVIGTALVGCTVVGSLLSQRLEQFSLGLRRQIAGQVQEGSARVADKTGLLLQAMSRSLNELALAEPSLRAGTLRQPGQSPVPDGARTQVSGLSELLGIPPGATIRFRTDVRGTLSAPAGERGAGGDFLQGGLPDSTVLRQHMVTASDAPILSGPLDWPGQQGAMLLLTRRLERAGRFGGLLGVAIDMRAVEALLRRGEPDAALITLLRDDGSVMNRVRASVPERTASRSEASGVTAGWAPAPDAVPPPVVRSPGVGMPIEQRQRELTAALARLEPVSALDTSDMVFAAQSRVHGQGVSVQYAVRADSALREVSLLAGQHRVWGGLFGLIFLGGSAALLLVSGRRARTVDSVRRLDRSLRIMIEHDPCPVAQVCVLPVARRDRGESMMMLVDANQAFCAAVNRTPEQLHGRLFAEVQGQEPDRAIMQALASVLRSGQGITLAWPRALCLPGGEGVDRAELLPLVRGENMLLLRLVAGSGPVPEGPVALKAGPGWGPLLRTSERKRLDLALEEGRNRLRRRLAAVPGG